MGTVKKRASPMADSVRGSLSGEDIKLCAVDRTATEGCSYCIKRIKNKKAHIFERR